MSYFFPPILIVVGMIVYQVSQKSTSADVNPFVVVIMAYAIGIMACLAGFFLLPKTDAAVLPMVKTAAWSALGIGLGAAAIEIGFMVAYRSGWNVNILPISVTVAGAALLVPIGLIAFRESLSIEKIFGILLCIGGLVLITIRK